MTFETVKVLTDIIHYLCVNIYRKKNKVDKKYDACVKYVLISLLSRKHLLVVIYHFVRIFRDIFTAYIVVVSIHHIK